MVRAFWDGSYAPHGYCLFWDPGLIWTHILADLVIAASYFSIPIALVVLVRRRRDIFRRHQRPLGQEAGRMSQPLSAFGFQRSRLRSGSRRKLRADS